MRRIILGAVLGSSLTLVVFLVGMALWMRNPLPLLNPELIRTAQQRWESQRPASYDLEVTLSGNRPGVVQVEVRDGEVTAMQRDNVTPSQQRTWDVWSVDGMFETLWQETEMAEEPPEELELPPGAQFTQRGEFDPQWGFPSCYYRRISGTTNEIGWEVTRFEVVP
jgi:hypothetical protein